MIYRTISNYIIPLFLFSLALFGFQQTKDVWECNAWSINYTKQIIQLKEIPIVFHNYPPNHKRAPIWLARNAVVRGDYEEAFQYINKLASQGNKDALVVKGEALAAQGNFHDAVDAWSKAGEFQLLLNAAKKSLNEQRLENALIAYRAAWILNPEVGTLPLANFFYWHYDNQDQAESLLWKAINQYPNSIFKPNWLNTLGGYLSRQEKWNEAESVYLKLLKETSFSQQAHIGLGWVYYGRGDGVKAAIDEFEKAIKASPESGEGYFNIGQLLVKENRYMEADAWFSKALEREPEMQMWYIDRGNAARESGNISLALRIYQDAEFKYPDWSRVYYELAWAFRLDDKPGNAKIAIEQALKLVNPPSSLYYLRAGQIYEWDGELDIALTYYQKALTLNSENKAAQSGIKRVMNAKQNIQK